MPVRLVVVDDHSLFRAGLVGLLNDYPDFTVIGEAGDGAAALEVIARLKPDVILMDVTMPNLNGVQAVERLRRTGIGTPVLMLTISRRDEDLFGAIAAGADGYLLKNAEPEELRKAILAVAQGKGILSPDVTLDVLRRVADRDYHTQPDETVKNLLTKRELEVLTCMAQGLVTAEIGAKLAISENTVKTHVRRILEKLESANRTEAVSKAVQMRLLRGG
ncbi:MAG: response regulator transcription factor [Anaerolineales bacterium]